MINKADDSRRLRYCVFKVDTNMSILTEYQLQKNKHLNTAEQQAEIKLKAVVYNRTTLFFL